VEFKHACWVAGTEETFTNVFSNCDGGDQDDSYQVFLGRIGQEMSRFQAKKAGILASLPCREYFRSHAYGYIMNASVTLEESNNQFDKKAAYILKTALKQMTEIRKIALGFSSVKPVEGYIVSPEMTNYSTASAL
jgi:hypothetical protein